MKIVMRRLLMLIIGLLCAGTTHFAHANTVLINFSNEWVGAGSPWNNAQTNTSSILLGSPLIDSTSALTSITISNGWNLGTNSFNSGSGAPAPSTGTYTSNIYGGAFITYTGQTIALTFSGLDGSGATSYNFTIYSSDPTSFGSTITTSFTLTGATSTNSLVLSSNGTTPNTTLLLLNAMPDSNGVLTLLTQNMGVGVSPLNFIQIDSLAVPEPTVMSFVMLSGCVVAGMAFRSRQRHLLLRY